MWAWLSLGLLLPWEAALPRLTCTHGLSTVPHEVLSSSGGRGRAQPWGFWGQQQGGGKEPRAQPVSRPQEDELLPEAVPAHGRRDPGDSAGSHASQLRDSPITDTRQLLCIPDHGSPPLHLPSLPLALPTWPLRV